MTLANSYLGITLKNNSHHLRNVNMTAFRQGVTIDGCADVSRWENVHIHPKYIFTAMGWAYPATVTGTLAQIVSYTIDSLVGFGFGHTDWQQLNGCFVIWSRIGMEFYAGLDGNPPSVSVVNSGVDVSQIDVEVESADQWAGVQFTNCLFVGTHVLIQPNSAPVKYTNCNFHPGDLPENPTRTTALIYQSSNATVTLTSCTFSNWDVDNTHAAAITLNQGVALLTGCEFFSHPGKRHFNLYNNASVSVVGSRFGHTLDWGNAGSGTGVFVANVTQ